MFVLLFFIGFWKVQCAKSDGPAMLFSCFSLFKKNLNFLSVLISKSRSRTSKNLTFWTLFSHKAFVFVSSFFFRKCKSVWYMQHFCEVRFYDILMFFVFFHVFFVLFVYRFLNPPKITFFLFWPVLRTSQIDLDPSKVMLSLW